MRKLKDDANVVVIFIGICLVLATFLSVFTLLIVVCIVKTYLTDLRKFQASMDAPNLQPVEFIDV